MKADPFASLTRRSRWRACAQSWRRRILRPWQPDRLKIAGGAPPHLFLVGIDTLRADHLGCCGYAKPTTPRLDALASRGTLFTDVTAPAPWTLPSFAGALTGLMPGLHGAYLGGNVRNMDTQVPRRLDPSVVTLASHLRADGYRTAAFYSNPFFAFGLAESFEQHAYHNLPAQALVEMAADWLRRHADRPCFCFVLLNDPHEPTTPPCTDLLPFLPSPAPAAAQIADGARWGGGVLPHLGRAADPWAPDVREALALKLAVYDAAIHQVDRALGWLQDWLELRGLARRTLVSVFSDHGEEFLDHATWAARWDHDPRGLRGIGHGQSHFQELLNVPWVAWGPGVPAGVRRTEPVSLLDVAPTLLGWLGLKPLPRPALPPGTAPELAAALFGRSLAVPGDAGTTAADRWLLAEALAYGPDLVAIRRGGWKLIAARDGRPLALFDLCADPGETRDAAGEHPEALAGMVALAAAWHASGLGAQQPGADGGGWSTVDETVRERLRDLGYSD